MAHRGDLLFALLRPGIVKLDFKVDNLEVLRRQGGIITHVDDVLQTVNAQLLHAPALQELRHPFAAVGGELALLDEGGRMVPHPGRFPGEYAHGVAVGGNHHVGVAVQDHEPAHVAHRAPQTRCTRCR